MAKTYEIPTDNYGLPILEFDEGYQDPNDSKQATLENLGLVVLKRI